MGLAIGVLVGVFGVRRRRLEYAGALHSGQSKGAQLLGIGVETGVWAGLATFASCALLLAYAVRMSRSVGWRCWRLRCARRWLCSPVSWWRVYWWGC